MKFLCGSCRLKYQIPDEKLQGRILTIRCKNCGAKIVVRESLRLDAGNDAAIAPLAEGTSAELGAASSSLRASHFAGGATVTRVAHGAASAGGSHAELVSTIEGCTDLDGFSEEMATVSATAPMRAKGPATAQEWYVAIDGQQLGPFMFAEVVRRLKTNEVLERHYVWHEGMGDWQRVRDVPALAAHASEARRRGPPPPPPPVKPPPPPPIDRHEARTSSPANVVDFASKRAERGFGQSVESAAWEKTDESRKDDSAKGSERADLFGLVHVEEVGVLSGGPQENAGGFGLRESTRFFVAAAGVNKRRSQQKIWMVISVVAAIGFAGFLGAWGTGLVAISLPGIGDPFANSPADDPEEDVEDPSSPGDLKRLLGEEERVQKRGSNPRRKRPSSTKDSNAPAAENGNPDLRREGAPAKGELVPVPLGDLKNPFDDVGDIPLPSAKIIVPPTPRDENTTMSDNAIRQALAGLSRSANLCYDQSLRAGEKLHGKLQIQVTVQPDGRVSRVTVETPHLRGSKLARCVAEKVENWRFASFEGSVQVGYLPFIFEGENTR